jgi:hypothetical protein
MGALLSQAVADQLRQVPPFVGPPNPNAGIRGIPTAEEEALQPTNISGDVVRNLIARRAHEQYGRYGDIATDVLAQLAPMVLGMETGNVSSEVSEALSGLRETTPYRSAPTTPFGKYTVESEMSPFERNYWRSMGEEVPRRPVPETKPLPELASQPGRFHGTPQEIRLMVPPEMVSAKGNLVGPGLYTTDDLAIARGYGQGGITYRIYEMRPDMKFLDEKEPIPLSALKRARAFLPGRTKMGGVGEAGAWDPQRWAGRPSYDVFKLLSYDNPSPENHRAIDAITKALREEGYDGLKHTGGLLTGGEKHAVKVYWDVNDVRLVPTHQYQTSYVRDVPIPGHPGAFGFRKEFKRISRPLMGTGGK